jgi:hypothetical protein
MSDESLPPGIVPSNPVINEEQIKTVIDSLFSRIQEERKQSEPYKDLFKASKNGIRGVLDKANDDIMNILMNVHAVLEEKGFDKSKSNELWNTLHLLPYMFRQARRDISKNEGFCCEADKMREIVYQWFMERYFANE